MPWDIRWRTKNLWCGFVLIAVIFIIFFFIYSVQEKWSSVVVLKLKPTFVGKFFFFPLCFGGGKWNSAGFVGTLMAPDISGYAFWKNNFLYFLILPFWLSSLCQLPDCSMLKQMFLLCFFFFLFVFFLNCFFYVRPQNAVVLTTYFDVLW